MTLLEGSKQQESGEEDKFSLNLGTVEDAFKSMGPLQWMGDKYGQLQMLANLHLE